MNLKPGDHVHLMGICGTAMASLAGILKDMGYRVTGSDQNVYPPMSTQLESLGIPIMEGYKKSNLEPKPDLVIVGNVISKHFEEAEALLASDIPYTSLPKAIGEFVIADRQSLVVAGTHGKTTTTSMCSWIAESCGYKPGFLIGGIPLNFSKSFKKPDANLFVIEGDEYDTAFFDKVPKFIHYRPSCAILTSIEFDHADIYKDIDEIKAAFIRLIELIPKEGVLVANGDDENIRSLIPKAKCRVLTYGQGDVDYKALDRSSISGRNHFAVEFKGERIADIALKHFGQHNTLNALSAFAMAREMGWPTHKVLEGLASFKGVKRRQEILGEVSGVVVVEDFAHHPTAVDLTIACMREQFPGRRLIAVFEPRSATSRRKVFQTQFAEALAKADIAMLAMPFDQSKIPEAERFSAEEVKSTIEGLGGEIYLGNDANHLLELLLKKAKSNDVILVMSNGGFDGIYQKLLKGLEQH